MDTSEPTAPIPKLEDIFGPMRLPIPLLPLEDELFSSWFVRVAHANGLRCNHLARILTGRGRPLFHGDIDRGIWKTPAYRLAELVGTTYEAAEKTLLSTYRPFLWPSHSLKGIWPFVLPVSTKDHKERKYGFQYCPCCLLTDTVPFYRRYWRLAFVVVCDVHGIKLRDRCPHCAAPIAIQRADIKSRYLHKTPSLRHCSSCHQSLCDVSAAEKINEVLLSSQRLILSTLDRGWININGRVIYSHLFFHGLRMLMSFLDDPRHSGRLQFRLNGLHIAKLESAEPKARRFGGFEQNDAKRRFELAGATAWIFQQWPNQFFDVLTLHRFNSTSILRFNGRSDSAVPYWLWEPVWEHLNKTMYVPTTIEIHNAAMYLFRQNSNPSIRLLCHLLNLNTNHSARVAKVWHEFKAKKQTQQ